MSSVPSLPPVCISSLKKQQEMKRRLTFAKSFDFGTILISVKSSAPHSQCAALQRTVSECRGTFIWDAAYELTASSVSRAIMRLCS